MTFRVLLVVICVVTGVSPSRNLHGVGDQKKEGNQMKESQEIHETYTLNPGAQFHIARIGGDITIETVDSNIADVQITRFAATQTELACNRISIDQTAAGLTIQQVDNPSECKGVNTKAKMLLRVPKFIDLVAEGLGGHLKVGEIEGKSRLLGIGGMIEIDQTTGACEITGIGGEVKINVRRVGAEGITVKGISGAVELSLAKGVNADLKLVEINSGVRNDATGIVLDKYDVSSYRTKLGSGGPEILVAGINGKVRLTRLGQ